MPAHSFSSASPRPWYRFQLVTVLFAGQVLLGVVTFELLPRKPPTSPGKSTVMRIYGWPAAHATCEGFVLPPSYPFADMEWNWSALALNVVVCAAVMLSTLFAFDKWFRDRQRRQFTLSSLVYLMAVVAILCAILSGQLERTFERAGLPYVALLDWQTVLRPLGWWLAVGVAALIYATLRLIVVIVSGSRVLLAPLNWDR